jgi:hypothetical protein
VTRTRIPNLGGARAFILHRAHPTVQAITRQLSAIGLITVDCWPELPPDALAADFVFFDADLVSSQQFRGDPGQDGFSGRSRRQVIRFERLVFSIKRGERRVVDLAAGQER